MCSLINITRRKILPPTVRPPQAENFLAFSGLFEGKQCRICIQKIFMLPPDQNVPPRKKITLDFTVAALLLADVLRF